MSKPKNPKYTTPKARAAYPWLNKPDTKFVSDGVFKTDLILSAEAAEPLIEQVDNALKAYAVRLQEETGKKQNIKKFRVPYEENEDGTYTFKVKQNAKINGEDVTLVFFDAKGKRLENPPAIFGGSIVCAAGTIRGYNSGANKGVTMSINAVQIIELSKGGSGGDADSFGFGSDEGGFEAGDDEKTPFESYPEADTEDEEF